VPVSGSRVLTRLFGAIVTLFITWTVVFGAMRLAPGDPVLLMLQGTPVSDAAMDAARASLGLDRPLAVQYVSFLANAARGDLGTSFRNRQPVTQLIADELPYTLQLAIGGLVVGLLLGGTLGIVAGVWPNGWIDTVCMTLALAGLSLPSFWIGMLLIQLFATQLGWVPVLGTGLDALILPSITLGLFVAGGLARLVRNSIIEVMTQDYIRTAHAKGLTALRVVAKHALRNAVIPPLTLLGIQFALLIGGAVVTETVFARPGIGRLLVRAVLEKDFPVVQGVVVFTTAAYVLINLLIDIAYGIIDPRVQA
jgi:ABC-type dipeptide/oligopeptide/nickel transport system permease component